MSSPRTPRKPARSATATKKSANHSAPADGGSEVRGELRQLADIRGHFPALNDDTAAALTTPAARRAPPRAPSTPSAAP
jgi:hypothetical protein